MFDFKTNVSCVLESIFAGFKDENIKMAADKITELHTDELESLKAEIHDMLKSDEVKNDYWGNLINNKAHLFLSIIDKHIAEMKGE